MPPAIKNGKSKAREGRQSRSRNTTPSSISSAPLAATPPSLTSYLEIPIGNLMVPTNISYDDILERHGGSGGIPDPSHLSTMVANLKQLRDLAATRNDACNAGMRALAERRKELLEEEQERERQREQASRDREAEEKESLRLEIEKRREEEEEEEEEQKEEQKEEQEDKQERTSRKGSKVKKKKDSSRVREERPLTHGAHGLARQDGLDLPLEGMWEAHRHCVCSSHPSVCESLKSYMKHLANGSSFASPYCYIGAAMAPLG